MVSILFADLVGFTTLSERLDAEDVRELQSAYFTTARTAVERHGGVLEKFIGDAVVAIWGAPTAQEDDAERAVRTAIELVSAVRELGERCGHPLALRAAVSTGETAVSIGAVGEGLVSGDVVNTTARMQSAAEPGSVLIDEGTRRATEAAIATEPAGSFELKGKAEPVTLWTALRVVAARRGALRAAGLEPPFVGRDRDLRLLKDLLHATADGGRAHAVSVSGIAGIGKSRLALEFEKYVDGLVDDYLWHRGRCLSYGDGVAFWALAEIVRMRARISDDEPAHSALPKLDAVIAQFVSDPTEQALMVDPLRQLIGLEAQSGGDRSRLFPAWRLLIERMADHSPVVLVFEDIQWADQGLLDFIEYLLEWSRNHRLFVVKLARPELADRRPGWMALTRGVTSIGLEPLTGDEMAEAVAGMVPGLPGELTRRIADGADGIPLYAVETVRMLLDRGQLVRTDGRVEAAGDLTALDIPETLHALVAARLDTLPEAERRVIGDAAVLGKTFTVDGLAAVSGVSPGELEPLLATLARRELISMQSDPRDPERGQYGFVQAMLRTIAYETMSRRDRKTRHLASAEYLRGIGGEELAEVIAAHVLDAYRLAPDDPDAETLRATAQATLLRASRRALSLAATGEALRMVLLAIELNADDDARADLLLQAGDIALATGDTAHAELLYRDSIDSNERAGDVHAAARVRAQLGNALFLQGRTDQAAAEMDDAYMVLKAQPGDEVLAELAAQYGRLLVFAGRPDEASEPLERSIEIAESLRLYEVLSHALNTKGLNSLSRLSRPEEARSLLLGALRIALEHDHPLAAMRAYFNLAFLRESEEHADDSYDRAGLELARRIGDRGWENAFQMHVAQVMFETGDWDDAERLVGEITSETRDAFLLGLLCWPLAMIHAYRGDHEAAAQAIGRSGLSAKSPDSQMRTGWAAAQGLAMLEAGRYAEAVAAAQVGMDAERDMGLSHPAVRICLVCLGQASLLNGDRDTAMAVLERIEAMPPGRRPPTLEAAALRLRAALGETGDPDALLRQALALLRQVARPWDVALVLTERARLLATSDPAAANEAVREAREIFLRLGATPAAERLPQPARSATL